MEAPPPPPKPATPSKLWYAGHVFFWVITGLICYILWQDQNQEAARRFMASLLFGLAI